METPICDFAREYSKKNPVRLHMPGHKGVSFLGMEQTDLTEIDGADSLYHADGIILASENTAGRLFGCRTFYSAEGSSLCIRAMLHLLAMYAKSRGERAVIFAGRNVHKTFLSAAALLDIDVQWLIGKSSKTYLSCGITASELEEILKNSAEKPTAVYLTSPDYLGNLADIGAISAVCKKYGTLLAVDNAHGAYLKFLARSQHPIDLGADICCDSAHKTLPALTGGAYLHIAQTAPQMFGEKAKEALALFGSTSPSYLILQSLDKTNQYLESYAERLAKFIPKVDRLKAELALLGFTIYGNEPLKVTLQTKPCGCTGTRTAKILAEKNIFCEFADDDFLVMMLTPENTNSEFEKVLAAFKSIQKREAIKSAPPQFHQPKRKLKIRQAVFAQSEEVPVDESVGRVASTATVSCPPAVPIVMCGEVIDEEIAACLKYYNVKKVLVVKE
ncbi:MAG: aminotransferase class I/II-fold pyridoxal phosphate-dependent enzyme [Ruminococcus sp.]|nr:aminotransferase class I/II-fold pyridoxal phosphate-dependent enzyme [Ruminococcus sp.]